MVSISLDGPGVLFVSEGIPQNGWGTPPAGTMEDRIRIRLGNGKLVHNGNPQADLTLPAGDYTAEAVPTSGNAGAFTLTIAPQ